MPNKRMIGFIWKVPICGIIGWFYSYELPNELTIDFTRRWYICCRRKAKIIVDCCLFLRPNSAEPSVKLSVARILVGHMAHIIIYRFCSCWRNPVRPINYRLHAARFHRPGLGTCRHGNALLNADPFYWESIGDRWIPFIKCQCCGELIFSLFLVANDLWRITNTLTPSRGSEYRSVYWGPKHWTDRQH